MNTFNFLIPVPEDIFYRRNDPCDVRLGEVADVAPLDSRTRIVEITEVNPRYDINVLTSKLAANVIMRALANGE